jgi:fructose-bisphosphate aldolase class II
MLNKISGIKQQPNQVHKIFKKAMQGGYAIPGFNVNNMEIIQGIMTGVKAKKSPVILQVSKGARDYASLIYLSKLIQAAREENPDIPIVSHLDHGDSFELAKEFIDAGFDSVMIDASKLPFEENAAETKKVVDYAHAKGVWVEAELGKIGGEEDYVKIEMREATYTDPAEAKKFVEETGCDSLAVSVGTSHGACKYVDGDPKIDFERLENIGKEIPETPLVLHGASSVLPEFVDLNNKYGGEIKDACGVPEEMLSKAAKMNVCKINMDTDFRLAMTGTIRKFLAENPKIFDPRKYLGEARKVFAEMVERKVEVCGSIEKG